MAAADSFVGEGLNPSPYKEALAEIERLRAERDALRALLVQAAPFVGWTGAPSGLADRIEAALAKGE